MNPCRPRSLAMLVFVVAIAGCNSVSDVLNKFNQAITEVQTLRESLERESTRWREQVKDSQLQLTHDVKDILKVDLRDNIDKSIGEAGIEVRCDFDFVNQHLITYLKGVERALTNKREQIKREGVLKGFATPDLAIADVIKSVGHLDPYICHTIPGRLVVTYKAGAPQERKADRAALEFVGYAMKRPADEQKKLTLYIFGPKRGAHGKELASAADLIAVSNPYKVMLESNRLLDRLDLTDTKIGLMWGEESLAEVLLGYNKQEPPPMPKITDIILYVGTTWDDKDKEIYFEYEIRRRSDNKQVGRIEEGRGVLWPDPRNPKPSWRSFSIPIHTADRFTEAERLDYRLYVKYHSTNGDPNWNGRFRAEAVVQGGRIIPVLGDTDDFDMPKQYKERPFDFNK